MQSRRSWIVRVSGLILSCVFAFTGILLLRKEIVTPGLIITLCGIVAFALTLILNDRAPVEEGDPNERPDLQHLLRYVLPVSLWCLSLALTGLVTLGSLESPQANLWKAVGWIASMVLAVVAMLLSVHWRPATRAQIRDWVSGNRKELIILLAILAVGLALRLYLIDSHPFPWSGDEASVGIQGRKILQGEVTDLFATGWSGQPNWSFTPTSLALILLGENIFAIRMVSIVEGTLAIVFLFLFAREMFGNRTALLAAGFLAAFPHHLQFSRMGVNNIIDSLLVCLVLWLVLRAVRVDRMQDYLWAGLATGSTFYTYVGSRLILAFAFAVLAYTMIRQLRSWRNYLSHVAIYLLGVFIVIAPMAAYFIRHPAIFMTRMGQESILLNHWLSLESARMGQSEVALIWRQFTDTILVFVARPAIGNFFNSPRPYLTILGSMFFLFGMAYAFVRCHETRMVALLGWFWAVVILGGVLTVNPPANTRLVMTTPASAIFVALGIDRFGDILTRAKLFRPRWQAVFGIILVIVLGVQNVFFYFGAYRTQHYFDDANSELSQKIGLELRELGPQYDLYLLGQPRVFASFPTAVFLAPKNRKVDVATGSVDHISIPAGQPALFVAIPENLSELQRVAELFAGGTWKEVPRQYKTAVLYYSYIVP